MGYFVRERMLRACGPNLPSWTVVFGVDDLTEAECQNLAASVQYCLDELHKEGGHGPWHIELCPSADDDSAVFVTFKSEWNKRKSEMDKYGECSNNSWQAEIHWLHGIALEHAAIIRELRRGQLPTVFLQCGAGADYETFRCVSSLTWDEIETLVSVLDEELRRRGLIFRLISDWHAEHEPTTYLKAKLSWNWLEGEFGNVDMDRAGIAAQRFAFQCIEEITALRQIPISREQVDDEKQRSEDRSRADLLASAVAGQPPQTELVTANESLRLKYRDPDNYWRNVWLYESRKAEKTNAAILAELASRSTEFAPLESDNALRNAIETIAAYHRWPFLKGKTGRPKSGK